MRNILLQGEEGDIRARLHCMIQQPCQCLDWPTTLILRMVPSDEEGEKEAKRQRSEPTTPISTSSRLPYEYDEVMGITQVDPREAERFEEGLDLEHHDTLENPQIPGTPEPTHMPSFSHGDCGSSSLRECIELLNNTKRNTPATLHSGVKDEKTSDPQQEMASGHRCSGGDQGTWRATMADIPLQSPHALVILQTPVGQGGLGLLCQQHIFTCQILALSSNTVQVAPRIFLRLASSCLKPSRRKTLSVEKEPKSSCRNRNSFPMMV